MADDRKRHRSSRSSKNSGQKQTDLSFRVKFLGQTFVVRPPRARRLGSVLAGSLPAILMLVLVAGSVGGMVNESTDATLTKYRDRIINTKEGESLPLFVYQRAIGHYANDVEIWEDYLAVLDKSGTGTKSIKLLMERAPEDGRGDARFHLALANRLLKLNQQNTRTRTMAERHLRFVTESANGTMAVQARRQLSLLQLLRGERDAAFNTLAPVMLEDPVAGGEALWIAWTTNMNFDVNAPDRVLARVDRDLRGQNVPETPKVLTKLRVMIIQNKEAEARDWLSIQKGVKPEARQQIESELAEMSMIASIVRNGTDKLPDWAKLQQLLSRDEDHPMWTRLAVAMWDGSDKPEAKPAREWVQTRLDQETTGLNLLRHALAVTSARYQATGKTAKDSELLRKLYRKVLAKTPDDILSLNNLSMLIYKYELDHLEEGLKLALHAQELAPQVPAVRDTVGEILARMGRWDEALPILEGCLAGLPDEWNLHNTLAQIYEKKGMADRSAAHKAAVARIKRPIDADNYDRLPPPKDQ